MNRVRLLSATATTIALLCAGSPARAVEDSPMQLVLLGDVIHAAIERKGDYVTCHTRLRLSFVNRGSEAVILVRPWHGDGRWFGGASVSSKAEPTGVGNTLVRQHIGESNNSGDRYRDLARRLDSPTPPPDLTVTIAPGDAWVHETTVAVVFETRKGLQYPQQATWSEALSHGTQHWLRVSFEVWPFNVETVRPNLGNRLKKRWRSHGRLFIGERLDRGRHHAILVSEPILLDLAVAEGFNSHIGAAEHLVQRARATAFAEEDYLVCALRR